LNGATPDEGSWPPEFFTGYLPFAATLPATTVPYRTEWRIFDKEKKLVGSSFGAPFRRS
jgi:hypothetical protein